MNSFELIKEVPTLNPENIVPHPDIVFIKLVARKLEETAKSGLIIPNAKPTIAEKKEDPHYTLPHLTTAQVIAVGERAKDRYTPGEMILCLYPRPDYVINIRGEVYYMMYLNDGFAKIDLEKTTF